MANDLLKVIIVDDERPVRLLLKDCINWSDYGYEITDEAGSAHEAIALIDEHNHDVVFTDINMPLMDGIEFSNIILEKYPQKKVVILTGYEEFDLVRESIKIGVSDYLLKPIDDEEIIEVIKKLKIIIESEKKQRENVEKMKEHFEANLPYMKENLLNQLTQKQYNIENIKKRMEYININIDTDYVQVAAVEVENKNYSEEKIFFLNIECKKVISDYFKDNELVFVFQENDEKTIILNTDKMIDLSDNLEPLKALLLEKLNSTVSIGVGNAYRNINGIRASYKEAQDALRYKLIAGNNNIINYNDISYLKSEDLVISNDFWDTFKFYVKAGLQNKALVHLDEFFEEYKLSNAAAKISSLRVYAVRILAAVMSTISEMDAEKYQAAEDNIDYFGSVFKIETLPEMQEYIQNKIKISMEQIKNLHSKNENNIISAVREFIDENYSDPDISLTGISKEYFVSISHLSRIFKKETGLTFIKYLNKVRMESAVKMLNETSLRAYQIADAVGMQDPHYFGTCFKKYTGMTVNDFRKSIANSDKIGDNDKNIAKN